MSRRTDPLAAYGRAANTETNPIQQIVMLYDGAIKFLRLAAADIESGELAAKAEHTNRALDIIGYLQSILDFERGGEVAPVLNTLYSGVTAMVLRASGHLDAALMNQAAALLAPVRDSWAINAKISPTP
jgi:flagellar protein FliS